MFLMLNRVGFPDHVLNLNQAREIYLCPHKNGWDVHIDFSDDDGWSVTDTMPERQARQLFNQILAKIGDNRTYCITKDRTLALVTLG